MITLVERENELSQLADLLAAAVAGKGHVVVIAGPVASGKTSLLRAFTERLGGSGVRCLAATAARGAEDTPLGVLNQLFQAAELPPGQAKRVARLLDGGALTARIDRSPTDPVGSASAQVLHGLCMALLELCAYGPLLITIDDMQYADAASLQCLTYLVRRMRSARILLVLTETLRPRPAYPALRTELLRQSHYHKLTLGPLSVGGVRALLAQHLPAATADRLAAECHVVSGGNPILVRELVADYRASPLPAPRGLVVGPNFGHAVVACLYRGDPALLKVAQGLAVLDEHSTPRLLGELLEVGPEFAGRALGALRSAGLTEAGHFRHPAARAAILQGMLPEQRAALHTRAAHLLDSDSVPAPAVARHLLAAGSVDGPWALPVLREAADQAIAEADIDLAVACLLLSGSAATDERQRAASLVALARAEWRMDPAVAARHLPDLLAAIRSGALTGADAWTPIHWLLWLGRVDEAVDAIGHLERSGGTGDAEATVPPSARLWLASLYPETRCGDGCDRDAGYAPDGGPAVSPKLQAARLLVRVVTDGPSDASVAEAEQILHASPLSEATLAPVGIALAVLIYCDRLDMAAHRCDALIYEAESVRAPTWQGFLTALRAEVTLRQGDLLTAESFAQDALSLISPTSWGVAIGLPLSTLIQACTAMGRYEDARAHLRMPVPNALFDTPVGLQYLRARGRFLSVSGQHAAALDDFRMCDRLTRKWGYRFVALIPWWADAAEAYLRVGRLQEARRLVRTQLEQLQSTPVSGRGTILRIRAAISEPRKRPALLRQAVEALRDSGERLELAYALADLGRAHHTLGEYQVARTIVRQASQLAEECGAEALRRSLADLDGPATGTEGAERINELSDAELRVATLAAFGHTNREIADRLFVTVSTVEQHLTRVYRKLDVNSRADLPLVLHPAPAEPV